MKGKQKKKGGKRVGAGRKPSGRQKEAVTVYMDVSKFGGKEGARVAIYEFLNGAISETGKTTFIPLEIPTSLKKSTKKTTVNDLTRATSVLKPQEQPKSNYSVSNPMNDNATIYEQIKVILAEKIPPHRDASEWGRKSWKQEQQKRIDELKKQLK